MSNHSARVAALAALAGVLLGSAVWAQPSPAPFGVDVFAGGFPRPDPPEEGEEVQEYPPMGGWQIGASVRHGLTRQWLGWTGSYGSYSNDDVRVREVLGGVRVTSPWLFGSRAAVRGFAHALTGYAWSRTASGIDDSAPAVVVGGGVDVLLLRLQVDYVRTGVAGVPRNSGRGFIGAMVPLCFSGCRPDWQDGIPLRRHGTHSVSRR